MAETRLPDGVGLAHPESLYIGGRWVSPLSGGRIEVVDPNTETLTARVAEASTADMDAAVAAARKAFDSGDVVLAQKIALETAERRALAVARNFMPNWH